MARSMVQHLCNIDEKALQLLRMWTVLRTRKGELLELRFDSKKGCVDGGQVVVSYRIHHPEGDPSNSILDEGIEHCQYRLRLCVMNPNI